MYDFAKNSLVNEKKKQVTWVVLYTRYLINLNDMLDYYVVNCQFYKNAAICSCSFLASSAAFSAKSFSFEA